MNKLQADQIIKFSLYTQLCFSAMVKALSLE